jgi:hypothetical protein
MATPICSPSRGLWCDQSEARRFRHCLRQSAGKTKIAATPQTRGSARVIDLARGWNSPASAASLQVSGRAGASPHQKWALF